MTEQTATYQLPALLAWAVQLPVINRLGLARRPKELVRFLKFAVVGSIGSVVDFSVLLIARERLGLPLSISVALGFTVAVLSNFTWNRLWTFPESRYRPVGSQLAQFFVVNVVGFGINEVVVLGLHPLFSMFLPDPPAYLIAKAIAIAIVLFWNFFINRIWTYRGID